MSTRIILPETHILSISFPYPVIKCIFWLGVFYFVLTLSFRSYYSFQGMSSTCINYLLHVCDISISIVQNTF